MLHELVALGGQVSEDAAHVHVLLHRGPDQATAEVAGQHFHLVTENGEKEGAINIANRGNPLSSIHTHGETTAWSMRSILF